MSVQPGKSKPTKTEPNRNRKNNDTCQVTDPITCTLFRPSPLASAPPVTPNANDLGMHVGVVANHS
ncbi:hypothetical protein YC2023_049890 [Brassica napus]